MLQNLQNKFYKQLIIKNICLQNAGFLQKDPAVATAPAVAAPGAG